jgi:DNA-binding MarR family transcriptional regulator
MAASVGQMNARVACLVGVERAGKWPPEHALAFLGLREAQRRLERELAAAIDEHGLSFSALGLLGQLATVDDRTLRLSALAAQSGLSLSRVSRVIDLLERRGLVVRQPCPGDARATNARLTGPGLELVGEAQASLCAEIERCFLDRLSAPQLETLADAFAALLDGEELAGDDAR